MTRLLTTFLLIGFSCFYSQQASACIQVPDTTVDTRLSFNAAFTEAELRFSNLRLHTEAPSIFCTCGLAYLGIDPIWNNIQYVAMVDSGTNDIYPGFVPWGSEIALTDAWEDFFFNNNWDALLSEVTSTGLTFNDPVELIFRFDVSGFSISAVDSAFVFTMLGTGMYDPITMSLSGDHNSVKFMYELDPDPEIVYDLPDSYFTDLDEEILSQLSTGVFSTASALLAISPNPASEVVTIQWPVAVSGILELIDLQGRIIRQEHISGQSSYQLYRNQHDNQLRNQPQSQLYFIRFKAEDGTRYHGKVLFE